MMGGGKGKIWMYLLGALPAVWLGLLIAPYLSGGLPELVRSFGGVMDRPFHIVWCDNSVRAVLLLLLAYGLAVVLYVSTRHNYRRGEEHGSAKWGDAETVCKKYRDKQLAENKLLTQNVHMGLDGRKHRRNLNTVVGIPLQNCCCRRACR